MTHDYINPTGNNESGIFGGQVTALQLNVDFSAQGKLPQTGSTPVGSLKTCNTGTSFDGQTIANLLAAANTAPGGGPLPAGWTYSALNEAVNNANNAFDNCNPSDLAQQFLCR